MANSHFDPPKGYFHLQCVPFVLGINSISVVRSKLVDGFCGRRTLHGCMHLQPWRKFLCGLCMAFFRGLTLWQKRPLIVNEPGCQVSFYYISIQCAVCWRLLLLSKEDDIYCLEAKPFLLGVQGYVNFSLAIYIVSSVLQTTSLMHTLELCCHSEAKKAKTFEVA